MIWHDLIWHDMIWHVYHKLSDSKQRQPKTRQGTGFSRHLGRAVQTIIPVSSQWGLHSKKQFEATIGTKRLLENLRFAPKQIIFEGFWNDIVIANAGVVFELKCPTERSSIAAVNHPLIAEYVSHWIDQPWTTGSANQYRASNIIKAIDRLKPRMWHWRTVAAEIPNVHWKFGDVSPRFATKQQDLVTLQPHY